MNDFRTPSTDISDYGGHYEVIAKMPGISKEDINIEVTPNSIEISANHEEDTEEQDKNWLRRERSSTSFYRSFGLPEQVKSEKVDAEFKDGILMVHLPKIEPTTKHEEKTVKVK
jgi:HSP20 family protein